ncbi:hypothetical protein AB0885_31995 [Streptomyces sp. NPDC005534]|uniref:NHL domain-containing protein n=1 Tax=Streptomyces sp. NPDC005534 TaxID=3155714 RepID=UPI003452D198
MHAPQGLAVSPDGTLYVADTFNHRIRRISADGIITTLAGTGVHAYTGDGGPAQAAALAYPRAVAVGQDGTVYIADMSNQRIRHVTRDNVISTLAGIGRAGFGGDDEPACKALLRSPAGVAVGPDGAVYVSDTSNQRIRCVTRDNVISTLAGIGLPGVNGDGGPADRATLSYPHAIAVGPGGLVHVITADRLRRFGIRH